MISENCEDQVEHVNMSTVRHVN